MPTQREVAIPLANYPSGTRSVTARNVPDWATHFAFEILRRTSSTPSIWPNASTLLQLDFDLFVDGEWRYAGGYTDSGGIADDDGTERAALIGKFSLAPGTNRQLRATIIITNGPLRTEGSLEFVG
jgi:hypothetical protein